jgi:hypothetical protein
MITTFSWLATRPSLKCFTISVCIKLKLIFKKKCNHSDYTPNCPSFFKPCFGKRFHILQIIGQSNISYCRAPWQSYSQTLRLAPDWLKRSLSNNKTHVWQNSQYYLLMLCTVSILLFMLSCSVSLHVKMLHTPLPYSLQ